MRVFASGERSSSSSSSAVGTLNRGNEIFIHRIPHILRIAVHVSFPFRYTDTHWTRTQTYTYIHMYTRSYTRTYTYLCKHVHTHSGTPALYRPSVANIIYLFPPPPIIFYNIFLSYFVNYNVYRWHLFQEFGHGNRHTKFSGRASRQLAPASRRMFEMEKLLVNDNYKKIELYFMTNILWYYDEKSGQNPPNVMPFGQRRLQVSPTFPWNRHCRRYIFIQIYMYKIISR